MSRQAGLHNLQPPHPRCRLDQDTRRRDSKRLSGRFQRPIRGSAIDWPISMSDVDQDVEDPEDHGDAEHRREIGAGKGLHRVKTQTRPAEDALDDQQIAEQQPDLQADHGQRGRGGIAQAVAQHAPWSR